MSETSEQAVAPRVVSGSEYRRLTRHWQKIDIKIRLSMLGRLISHQRSFAKTSRDKKSDHVYNYISLKPGSVEELEQPRR